MATIYKCVESLDSNFKVGCIYTQPELRKMLVKHGYILEEYLNQPKYNFFHDNSVHIGIKEKADNTYKRVLNFEIVRGQ